MSKNNHNYVYLCIFFNHPFTTKIYTLSLHDALPILETLSANNYRQEPFILTLDELDDDKILEAMEKNPVFKRERTFNPRDRKSTRLNSSHVRISYAVFCMKIKIFFNKSNESILT